jgi:hypothetical protein
MLTLGSLRGSPSQVAGFRGGSTKTVNDPRSYLCLGAPEHCQFPRVASLVQTENVEIAIVTPDFEVGIVWAEPPIEVFGDFDTATTEMKALQLPIAVAGIALDLHLHVLSPPCDDVAGWRE